jgi:hypothetical protein
MRSPRFRRTTWYFADCRPPPLAQWVHPLVSFTSPSEFSGPYPPECLSASSTFLGVSSPSRHQLAKSTLRGQSQARFVPPSAFLAPSTVCSFAGLAGLFHPAATSGMNPSGVFPPSQPYHLVGGRCPLAVRLHLLSKACAKDAEDAAPSSGPCSAPESVASRRGLACAPLDPLLGFASPGFSPSSPCRCLHSGSAHGLGREPVQARSRD